MANFESCRNCVAPKRHPGCHGQCEAYLQEKAEYERKKAEQDRAKAVQGRLTEQRTEMVRKARKKAWSGNRHA